VFKIRTQFLRETSVKMAVFWGGVLCSLVDIDRCFESAYCLQHRPYVGDSKYLCNVGNLNRTTRRNIPF
jgi:hypothetical protein